MRKNLLFVALLCASILTAQNTIGSADPVDGTEDLSVTTAPANISDSGLMPSCVSGRPDLFYSHDVSTGDNKVTIGLNMTPNPGYPTTTINVQILRAVGGNITTGIEQVQCLNFTVTAAGGGSFSQTIDNGVLEADDYFLRIYVPNGLSISQLNALTANTDITMTSEFDATLSSTDFATSGFSYKVLTNSIELRSIKSFKSVYVFDIAGKQIMNVSNDQTDRSIDISGLRNGVYIMNLIGNEADNRSIKFVKK